MRLLRSAILASVAAVLLCPASALSSSFALAQSSSSQTAPDNSGQNSNQAKTAEDQSNATADRQITAKGRRALMADKDLSTYAHNVKIITSNGNVTLKGPVKSEEEKQKVVADVANIVSADRLTNKLTVKQP